MFNQLLPGVTKCYWHPVPFSSINSRNYNGHSGLLKFNIGIHTSIAKSTASGTLASYRKLNANRVLDGLDREKNTCCLSGHISIRFPPNRSHFLNFILSVSHAFDYFCESFPLTTRVMTRTTVSSSYDRWNRRDTHTPLLTTTIFKSTRRPGGSAFGDV